MDFVAIAAEAARIGGGILQDWAERFTVNEKGKWDLVTEADVASQEAIHEFIAGQCPAHGFLGEEGLQVGSDSDYRWVIDPLDGTSNYVHGFPYYAVSIGLEHQGELVAGVVYDPTRDELFAAAKGGGATRNGQPIQVSTTDTLQRTLAMASLPVGAGRDHPGILRFLSALEQLQHVQRTGSAALNLCAVAYGAVEVFWSVSLKPWDMAAGALIVREAGGTVTQLDGGLFTIEQPNILASNGTGIHEEMQQVLDVE